MISRSTIYEHFVNNVSNNIATLNTKICYYNDRLDKSKSALDIHLDTLLRHDAVFFIIYDINVNSAPANSVKINYINKTVIDANRGIRRIVKLLHDLSSDNGTHTVIFIRNLVDRYLSILTEISNIKRQLQLFNDKLTFFNKYKDLSRNVVFYIISKSNSYYENLILNGETVYLGHDMGFIKVVPKKAKGKVNWNESFKYRDTLIKDNRVPYNKADYLKAKAANVPYDGVKWFIPYDNDIQHYINWYPYSRKLPNKAAYTFTPARYNKSGITISKIKETATTVAELDTYHIGIVNKLNLALDINELQFIKYARYDI